MSERLHPSSIPVQNTPNFHTAVEDYKAILGGRCLVPPQDISRIEAEIKERNKTRGDGNRFINHVAELKRGFNLP